MFEFRTVFNLFLIIVSVTSQYLSLPEGTPCTWLGLNGTCALIHQCYSAKENIKEKRNPPICDYQGNDPIICCTDCELVEDSRKIIFNSDLGFLYKTGQKAHDHCLDYVNRLDYPCKRLTLPKEVKFKYNAKLNCNATVIESTEQSTFVATEEVGGRDALRYEYPHMGLLGYGHDSSDAQWLCGGSVISENYILTAGHCTHSPSQGNVTFVRLGILLRSDPQDSKQMYGIKTIIPHPNYKPPSKYNDIALLKTDRPITFSSDVQPACLHFDDEVDISVEATGWGTLGHGQPLANNLQSVILQKFTTAECSSQYPPHRHLIKGFDVTTQLCYGDRKEIKDTCTGDSGGPLQVVSNNHTSSCVYTILGVTSIGLPCGIVTGNSGIYTKVNHYVPWIESIVWPDD